MPTAVIDYLIVGQGLAGSCLALQLLKRKKSILVYDTSDPNSATRVAAGLFNPITGKVMGKTWKADVLFPFLETFYREAEQVTQAKFFHPMPLYRPFTTIEEQNEWMGRSADRDFIPYIENLFTQPFKPEQVHNALGGLMLKHCGYIHTGNLLSAVRNLLIARDSWRSEKFHEQEMTLSDGLVTYQSIIARKLIYCNGVDLLNSRYFSWLPLRLLKGETLTIQSPATVHTIFNRGVYMVPDIWTIGATYSKTDREPKATNEGRNELEVKLNELIAFPYSITAQNWGFRPTTPDRRPMLGYHPEFRQLAVFNGLGTKGVSLAPYFSEILTDWMENGKPVPYEVDLNRFKSLYSKSA
jgi:glycine oxidase